MSEPTRVVILGGGFGGLSTAEHFEHHLPADANVEVYLVSRDNYLLYTPMLAEAATGEINPTHIAVPLRASLRRVHVRPSEVAGVDLQRRVVQTQFQATGDTHELPYDHLILALGSVTSFKHAPGAETYSIPFKHLGDAAAIRDRVIDCFEQAVAEPDHQRRRALLTFVVAGGGFSGVELAAALADFLRETRRLYPRLTREDKLRLVLAHHGKRLLEELDEVSAAYTLRLLKQQGIAVRLGTAVCGVAADSVQLDPGGTIPTHTVFWTAGVAPSPLVESLPLPKDHHGAVLVDQYLAVKDHPGIWAIGDCASIPNPHDGGTYAPLAQNAEREGPVVAQNVLAAILGGPRKAFDYKLMGTFASLGSHTAVGRVFDRKFHGLLAWFMWRSVYLAKLPGRDRKVRVATDWLLDFMLPPDTVAFHVMARGAARALMAGDRRGIPAAAELASATAPAVGTSGSASPAASQPTDSASSVPASASPAASSSASAPAPSSAASPSAQAPATSAGSGSPASRGGAVGGASAPAQPSASGAEDRAARPSGQSAPAAPSGPAATPTADPGGPSPT